MTDQIAETELSLADDDLFIKIKDILAAKYGVIAVNEPVLHTAVANAAALNLIIAELRHYHRKQHDDRQAEYQTFRDGMSDTLLYFEKNMITTIQKAVSETCIAHIEQFRIISQKQTAQVKYLIDTELPGVLNPVLHDNKPAHHPVHNLILMGAGAAIGTVITLLAVLCVV
jgi:hypothetical protein